MKHITGLITLIAIFLLSLFACEQTEREFYRSHDRQFITVSKSQIFTEVIEPSLRQASVEELQLPTRVGLVTGEELAAHQDGYYLAYQYDITNFSGTYAEYSEEDDAQGLDLSNASMQEHPAVEWYGSVFHDGVTYLSYTYSFGSYDYWFLLNFQGMSYIYESRTPQTADYVISLNPHQFHFQAPAGGVNSVNGIKAYYYQASSDSFLDMSLEENEGLISNPLQWEISTIDGVQFEMSQTIEDDRYGIFDFCNCCYPEDNVCVFQQPSTVFEFNFRAFTEGLDYVTHCARTRIDSTNDIPNMLTGGCNE